MPQVLIFINTCTLFHVRFIFQYIYLDMSEPYKSFTRSFYRTKENIYVEIHYYCSTNIIVAISLLLVSIAHGLLRHI